MFSHSQGHSLEHTRGEPIAPEVQNPQTHSPAYSLSVFLTALLIQVFFLLLGSLLLDGGRMLRCVQIAVLSHWAATAIVLFRRPTKPTPADLLIVKYAFLGILVLVAAFGWPLVQLLGLER